MLAWIMNSSYIITKRDLITYLIPFATHNVRTMHMQCFVAFYIIKRDVHPIPKKFNWNYQYYVYLSLINIKHKHERLDKNFPSDRAHLAVCVWPLLTTASSNINKFENSETKFSNDQLRTMDRHSHRRRHHRSDFADQRLTELARAPNKRFNINTTRLAKILATGLIILPILVILSLITRQHPSDHTVGLADARILEARVGLNITTWRLRQVTAGLLQQVSRPKQHELHQMLLQKHVSKTFFFIQPSKLFFP